MDRSDIVGISSILDPEKTRIRDLTEATDAYLDYFRSDLADQDGLERRRKDHAKEISDRFYDLATDFYEYGWGQSFHFAPLEQGQSLEQCLAKHEFRMALKLGLRAGHTVVDLGCGIGGPARNIADFSQARVKGLNCNGYQLARARLLTDRAGLTHLCTFIEGDFCHVPLSSASVDHVFAMEATCHADDLRQVYGEAFRILRPGGRFGCYEWTLTEEFNPTDPEHQRIKHEILEGNGVPDLISCSRVVSILREVGFEIEEAGDLAPRAPIPWYRALLPSASGLRNFRATSLGRHLTHAMLVVMETVGMAPRGSVKVHATLQTAASGLIAGGQRGIFTPMFFFLARKPTWA